MVIKVGFATGTCPRCGKSHSQPRPTDLAVCDCWEYCPRDHGHGSFSTRMEDYTPDLTLNRYGAIEVKSGSLWGDLQHPIKVLKRYPICNYLSVQKRVEVKLK